MSKPFYKSKVLWFNLLAAVVLVASQFGYVGFVSPEIEGYVSALLPLVVLGINAGLRLITKQPLARS